MLFSLALSRLSTTIKHLQLNTCPDIYTYSMDDMQLWDTSDYLNTHAYLAVVLPPLFMAI